MQKGHYAGFTGKGRIKLHKGFFGVGRSIPKRSVQIAKLEQAAASEQKGTRRGAFRALMALLSGIGGR